MTAVAKPTGNPWLLAIRLKTLPAAVTPVLTGSALAWHDGQFVATVAVVALLVALLLQIVANLANDLLDFKRGADTAERLGPARVTQSGLIAPETMLQATVATVAVTSILGLYLIWRGGWPILALGIAALLAALAYTGGPFPLGYHGLGDLFVLIFFGFVGVAGTYYVQAQQLTGLALVTSLPIGALATAIIVVNNLRDLETDQRAGKRTLAVRLGRSGTQREYLILLAIAYLTPPLLWLGGALSPAAILPLLTLPLAWQLVRQIRQWTGRALNATLAGTARLELIFGLLFSIALLLPQ